MQPPTQPPTQPTPQGSYPQQPPFPPPPPQPAGITIRGRRIPVWGVIGIVVGALLVLSCGCCGTIGLVGALNTPKTTPTVAQANATNTTAPQITQATATATQPQATAKPTSAPKWTVTHTYSGNGTNKTAPFTVNADQWRITWSCNPAAYGSSYNLIADLTVPGDQFGDNVVNVICSTSDASSRSGTTNEYTSGTFYLDITSEASWTFKIEELK